MTEAQGKHMFLLFSPVVLFNMKLPVIKVINGLSFGVKFLRKAPIPSVVGVTAALKVESYRNTLERQFYGQFHI
jgi:hypothetical protein